MFHISKQVDTYLTYPICSTELTDDNHCVKSVHIWSYSGPHFPVFGLNTERDGVSLHIQSECREMWTRLTPNKDTSCSVVL